MSPKRVILSTCDSSGRRGPQLTEIKTSSGTCSQARASEDAEAEEVPGDDRAVGGELVVAPGDREGVGGEAERVDNAHGHVHGMEGPCQHRSLNARAEKLDLCGSGRTMAWLEDAGGEKEGQEMALGEVQGEVQG